MGETTENRTDRNGEQAGDDALARKVDLQELALAELEADPGHADAVAPVSWEEIEAFVKDPHRDYSPEKLHAIYKECGHVREVADRIGGHAACGAETALGLYRAHGRDEEQADFARRLIRLRKTLSAELAQLIFDDHLRENADRGDFPLFTRRKMESIYARAETIRRVRAAVDSMLASRIGSRRRREIMLIRARPEGFALTKSPEAWKTAVMIEKTSAGGDLPADYTIAYDIASDWDASRRILLPGGESSESSIVFCGSGYSGPILESEAQNLLADLEHLQTVCPVSPNVRRLSAEEAFLTYSFPPHRQRPGCRTISESPRNGK